MAKAERTDFVTLTLDAAEVEALMHVFHVVGGDPQRTLRGKIQDISMAIRDCGFEYPSILEGKMETKGDIMFIRNRYEIDV